MSYWTNSQVFSDLIHHNAHVMPLYCYVSTNTLQIIPIPSKLYPYPPNYIYTLQIIPMPSNMYPYPPNCYSDLFVCSAYQWIPTVYHSCIIPHPLNSRWQFFKHVYIYIYFLHSYTRTICHLTYIKMGPWWRHQMEAFYASLALCVGNSPVTGKFSLQRPVMWSLDVFFVLHLLIMTSV